jgi:uncharacterized protein DUF2585
MRLSPTVKKALPILATVVVILITAVELHFQGRVWKCDCGNILFWSGDAWGPETSQHLFDPYTFTHILHGLGFCGLLAWSAAKLRTAWRFWLAILIESVWEIIENTNFVIQRYREATAALGYNGDSVINSLGDIVACGVGFWIARQLGFKRSVVVFALVELVLLITIRDSLLLNIVMLIYNSEGIKAWQAGH